MQKDALGDRIKTYYENRSKTYLIKRTPVSIRLDMRAGHTFTKGFERPFDRLFMLAMQLTTQYLCEKIQGCILGYTQSDEITLILQDYKTLTTDAWFDYSVQKVCSISASMTTMFFNKTFEKLVSDLEILNVNNDQELIKQYKIYRDALENGAMFDARCFNIPKEEVTNLIYWRQLDATRNSIQMVGQANFSHTELQNKSCSQIQDLLMEQKNINWNNFSVSEKRGTCCIKKQIEGSERTEWIIDDNIPIFVNEGREYIEKLINCEE